MTSEASTPAVDAEGSLLRICLGSSCFARGNRDLVAQAQAFCQDHAGLRLEMVGSLCAGSCLRGPVVELDGTIHEQVDGPALQRILAELREART